VRFALEAGVVYRWNHGFGHQVEARTLVGMHVIFGSGAAGLATLDALRRRGEPVRMVNRSGHAPAPEDVEVVAAAGDRESVEMLYQFTGPFLVDSQKITNKLGIPATPAEQALERTLAAYRRSASGVHP